MVVAASCSYFLLFVLVSLGRGTDPSHSVLLAHEKLVIGPAGPHKEQENDLVTNV
jgi:hypothetical protein